jgi:hypothetical protein
MGDALRQCVRAIAVATILILPPNSDARTIRVDSSAEFIDGAELANDGYVEVELLAGPSGARVPFSINFFGNVFDSVYVNENGVVSFGAPLNDPPRNLADVFRAGIPVIVPYFADADIAGGGGRLHLTRTTGINLMMAPSAIYQGSTGNSELVWQVAFFGSENSTDFTLELNYDALEWESGNLDGGTNGFGGIPPRVGFSDGFGRTFQIPGSGISGALPIPLSGCSDDSLSVSCNDYLFEFRNGLPYRNGIPIFAAPVPEPMSAVLVLTALGLFALRRRFCA